MLIRHGLRRVFNKGYGTVSGYNRLSAGTCHVKFPYPQMQGAPQKLPGRLTERMRGEWCRELT